MAQLTNVKVGNEEVFAELSRRLEDAGRGDLQTDLIREIRAAGEGPLRAVRQAWLGIEVWSTKGGGSSSGLRGRVSAATDMTVNGVGIRYSVDGDQVDPAYGRSLVYLLNGTGRWRHPTFGRKPWVTQRGEEVFHSTLSRQEPVWRAGVEKAMDKTAQKMGI